MNTFGAKIEQNAMRSRMFELCATRRRSKERENPEGVTAVFKINEEQVIRVYDNMYRTVSNRNKTVTNSNIINVYADKISHILTGLIHR